MVVATVVITFFIIRVRNMHYRIAELFFLLPFSATMNLSTGMTSLFLFPKLAVIIMYLFKSKGKMSKRLITTLFFLVIFSVGSNILMGTIPVTRVFNLVLWFLIAYIIFDVMREGIAVESWAFVCGVIFSGLIGLLKDFIPRLAAELVSAQYLNESTGVIVVRFAGLWNDPNGFTFFIICSLCVFQWMLMNRRITIRAFIIGVVILSSFGLATLSKSCILMMLLFWICFIFFQNSVNIKVKIGTILLLGGCLILLYSSYSEMLMEVVYRFTRGSTGSNISFASITTLRNSIWGDYLSAYWSGNILFGNGIDAPIVGGYGCHNTYIQLLYEWGIIGVTVYLGLWINVLKSVQRTINKRNWVPFLFLLILAFSISCLYIEFFYFLIPFMLRAGESEHADEKNKYYNLAYDV